MPNNEKHIPPRKDGRLSDDKRYFKAVSNYMANVLGIDRNEISKMLAEKIEQRNVDQAVLETVQRYFGVGVNGYCVDGIVKTKIDKLVEEHVKATLQKGASAWMDKLIQEKLEEMMDNERRGRLDAVKNPTCTAGQRSYRPRPGQSVYNAGAYIEIRLIDAIIGQWLENNLGRRPDFETKLRSDELAEAKILVRGICPEEARAFEELFPRSHRVDYYANTIIIGPFGVAHLIAKSLGWNEISRIVAGQDGVCVFPPEI